MNGETIFDDILIATSKAKEIILLRRLIARHPTNIIACLKLGNLLKEQGDYIGALKLHKSLLTGKIPLKIRKNAHRSIIENYIGTGDQKLATHFTSELQKLAPKDKETLEFLYSIYENQSKWKEAINLRNKLLKLNHQSDDRGVAILYAFWGDSLIKEGNQREGLKHLNQALKLDRLCMPALLFIGDFWYESGAIDKAIESWNKILTNLPDYAFLSFDRLERAYYEAKHDLSGLESLYTSFLNTHPENVKALIKISAIYEKRGEDAEAISVLERASEIEPQNPVIRKKLFKLYYDNNRYADMFKQGNQIADFVDCKEFKCYNCNTQFKDFKFKCPICNHWLTVR